MQSIPTRCPLCGGEVTITRIYCRECDTTIEGRFNIGVFAQLKPEQLQFVQMFIRNEGKITRMEDELGLSYPTIRKTLHEIIRAMGFEPGGEEVSIGKADAEEKRQRILEDLDAGRITAQQAMRTLKEMEA